jgi:D-alanine-D-alanine ligase
MGNREEFKGKRIGVLMGGMSAEREVSLMSGQAIGNALRELGYEARLVEADQWLAQRLGEEKIDVAFIGLHGRLGEDGAVQGLLEMMRIPYTGSGVLASALAMDKVVSRQLFILKGLPVPRHRVFAAGDIGEFDIHDLPFPLPMVVKPSQEGSSVGVTIVAKEEEISRAMEIAFEFGPEILIEEYIRGREIQVGILDDAPLGAIEIVPRVQFYSYEAKYTPGLADHLLPAPLPHEDYDRALQLGLEAHRLLGCEGATRVDLLYTGEKGGPGPLFVLEVNTLPGMTALSLLPEIARGAGIDFPTLVERILLGARLKIPVKGRGSWKKKRDDSP